MFTIILVAVLLVLGCVTIHGFTMQSASRLLFRGRKFSFSKVGVLIVIAILAHLTEIVMFEFAYLWLVRDPDHGTILGSEFLRTSDLFYFSAVTYTSTGYGDLVPVGNLRFMAIVEALTGLIMIAWTTSFAFLVMQKFRPEQIESESKVAIRKKPRERP